MIRPASVLENSTGNRDGSKMGLVREGPAAVDPSCATGSKRLLPQPARLRPPPSATSRPLRGRLPRMSDVTRILSAIEHGDPPAAEQLLPLVYDELRQLAAQRLAQEKPG